MTDAEKLGLYYEVCAGEVKDCLMDMAVAGFVHAADKNIVAVIDKIGVGNAVDLIYELRREGSFQEEPQKT